MYYFDKKKESLTSKALLLAHLWPVQYVMKQLQNNKQINKSLSKYTITKQSYYPIKYCLSMLTIQHIS